MTSLHPVILICWLVLAACVTIVGYLMLGVTIDWWERRQDARTYQIRTRHHQQVRR